MKDNRNQAIYNKKQLVRGKKTAFWGNSVVLMRGNVLKGGCPI